MLDGPEVEVARDRGREMYMSRSKRILFGDDPADDAARTAIAIAAARMIGEFPCKVATRRKNRLGSAPRWDPFWANAVTRAARQLWIEVIQVNDQICARTQDEAAKIKETAERLWEEARADFEGKRNGRR